MRREYQLENSCGGSRAQAWVAQSSVGHWGYAKDAVGRWGSWRLKKKRRPRNLA